MTSNIDTHDHVHTASEDHHHHGDQPQLMRSCRFNGVNAAFSVDTVAIPEIGEDEALVRVVASGICRSDWHLWKGDWSWVGLELPLKTVLGHEIGGVIVKVGAGVKRVGPGMRVTMPFNYACGFCDYCRQGKQNLCDNLLTQFTVDGGGGWQEFIRVPLADMNCIPLPDGVDELTAAALGCRYMTAWRAVVNRGQVRPGEFVAVHGCGGVGLAAIQISGAIGGRTIAVDIDDEKLIKAKETGAFATVNARGLNPMEVGAAVRQAAGGVGAHVAVDALGGTKTTLGALFSLRKAGRLAQVGLTSGADKGNISLPMDIIVMQELQISGSCGNPQSDYPNLMGLVASGKLTPAALVSREVGLDDVQGVLQDMDDYKTSGYVIITRF
jgi:propanol-preferring alcohol dehydrogenase